MNLTETSWTVEDSKRVADLVDASVHEVPEADWDIAMAEITAHLLTAYRGIESLPVPAAPREASLSFVAASRFLSAALIAIDEGCIAVWSDDLSGDTIGVGRSSGTHQRVEKPPLSCYFGAEDGIRTRDPHLGKVIVFVHGVHPSPLGCDTVHPVSIWIA